MRTRTRKADTLTMVIASGRISNCILNHRIAAAYHHYSSKFAGINISNIEVTNHELQSWSSTILLGLFLRSMSSRALTRSWRPCFPPVAHETPTLKRCTDGLNALILLPQSHEQWRRLIRARDLIERSGNNFSSLPQTHEASLWNSRYVCSFARLCSCVSDIK